MFVESLPDGVYSEEQKAFQVQMREKAFPGKKAEEFKYISLRALEEANFTSFGEYNISCDVPGVEIIPMDVAIEKYGFAVLGRLQKGGERIEGYFSSINRGFAKDRYCIFVGEDAPAFFEVQEHLCGNDSAMMPQILYFVEGAKKFSVHHKILVEGERNFISRLVDVQVEKGVELTMYETATIEADNSAFFHTVGSIKGGGIFKHRSGTKGCKLFRNEIKTFLLERDATCSLEGFWNGAKNDSIHHHVHCSHLAEETNSRQHYQGVSSESARASFEGQIYVDKVAQKTDSYQLSKHLLIGEKARGFSKPNLEVFADDVIASHGATATALDEEELFYLTSRGIPKDKAASLLKRGFLSFFFDKVEEESVRAAFMQMVR
ncbi:SufD family Fe-S cluster assembly protein [bacterium]|nr:SufD family Fe-S cluster assembly protein [bacterium]